MSNYAISLKRTSLLLAALTFTALLMVVNLASFFGKAGAAQLTNRSLTLSSTLDNSHTAGDPGTETNGAAAEHTFGFTALGAATSATFTYCTTALGNCVTPTGLVIPNGAVVSSSGTAAGDGDNVITWTSGISPGSVTVTFEGIANPDYVASPVNPDDNTFFVRIQTIAAGPVDVDEGTVASAITQGISITARVAETLGFSVTGDFDGVGAPGGTCAALTGAGAITLGNPDNENTLSLTEPYDNYSAFRLYTNAANGVAIQYEGDTLRHSSGNDTISPIGAGAGTETVAAAGTEQFGLAVDTVVGGGPDVDSASREEMDMSNVDNAAAFASNGALVIDTAYDEGDGAIASASFAFLTNDDENARVPDTIATTAGYTECKTVPVRYVANISPTTTSGTYTTTIVYSAVPTY